MVGHIIDAGGDQIDRDCEAKGEEEAEETRGFPTPPIPCRRLELQWTMPQGAPIRMAPIGYGLYVAAAVSTNRSRDHLQARSSSEPSVGSGMDW